MRLLTQYIQVHLDILLHDLMTIISVTIPLWIQDLYKILPSGKLTFCNGISPSSIGNTSSIRVHVSIAFTEASQLGIDSVEAWWIASTEPPSEAVERILGCDRLALLGFLGLVMVVLVFFCWCCFGWNLLVYWSLVMFRCYNVSCLIEICSCCVCLFYFILSRCGLPVSCCCQKP